MDSNKKPVSLAPNVFHSGDNEEELLEHIQIIFPEHKALLYEHDSTEYKIDLLIKYITKFLKKTPPDCAHDHGHHIRVWKNVQYLISKGGFDVDEKIMKVCSLWHDVDKHNNDTSIEKYCRLVDLDSRVIRKINKIILDHRWSSKPVSLESKLLFDADKLEYVSVPRWNQALFYNNKDNLIKLYFEGLNKRLPEMYKKMNFDVSKKIYKTRHNKFIKWAKENKLIEGNKLIYKNN